MHYIENNVKNFSDKLMCLDVYLFILQRERQPHDVIFLMQNQVAEGFIEKKRMWVLQF